MGHFSVPFAHTSRWISVGWAIGLFFSFGLDPAYAGCGTACPNGLSDCPDGIKCKGAFGSSFPLGCDECWCIEPVVTIECFPIESAVASGGHQVIVECHVIADREVTLSAVGVDLPCSLPGGNSGSVDVVDISVEFDHPFPPPLFTDSWSASFDRCRASTNGVFVPPVTLAAGERRYVATFVYETSTCAAGSFQIPLEGFSNPPDSSDETVVQCPERIRLAFDHTPATLTVTTGTCCNGESCVADGVNETCCVETLGGISFVPGKGCDHVCPCGVCQLHGDCFPEGGNCLVDLDDVLYILAAFADGDPATNFPGSDLAPCDSTTGLVDVDDVMSTLAAFAGNYDCTHPCPP